MFIFLESNGGYCVYYPSNIFCNKQDLLKIGECHSDVPQFCSPVHIQSCDAFRPIVCKQKYLMDSKHIYTWVHIFGKYFRWSSFFCRIYAGSTTLGHYLVNKPPQAVGNL